MLKILTHPKRKSSSKNSTSLRPTAEHPVLPIENRECQRTGQVFVLTRFLSRAGDIKHAVITSSNYADKRIATQTLLNEGADLPADLKAARVIVSKCLQQWPTKHVTYVNKSGWHGENENRYFLLPGRTITLKNGRYLRHGEAGHYSVAKVDSASRGTLAEYIEAIRPHAAKSDYVTFAFALGCSGQTLFMSPIPESGLFVFIGDTSTGKTTILRCCSSVMMSSAAGSLLSSDFTGTALEEHAGGKFNDRTMPIDELATLQGAPGSTQLATLKRMVLMLAGGQGRSRSKKAESSGLPRQTWRMWLATTAETSFRSEIRKSGKQVPEGLDTRFIEIPVPKVAEGGIFNLAKSGSTARAADELSEVLENHYGVAELAFVKFIESDRAAAKAAFKKGWDFYLTTYAAHLTGAEKRIAKKFAHVFASGSLAVAAGVAPFELDDLERACAALQRLALKPFETDTTRIANLAKALLKAARDPDNKAIFKTTLKRERVLCVACSEDVSIIMSDRDQQFLIATADEQGQLFKDKNRRDTKVLRPAGDRPRSHTFKFGWLKSVAQNL